MDPFVDEILPFLLCNRDMFIPLITYLVFFFLFVRVFSRIFKVFKKNQDRGAALLKEARRVAGNPTELQNKRTQYLARKDVPRVDRTQYPSVSKSQYTSNQMDNQSCVKSQAENRLKDDLNNDWLAKQLREEAKAKQYVTDMFQLKNSHSMSCDARSLRDYHADNCDAEGIDTATIRR